MKSKERKFKKTEVEGFEKLSLKQLHKRLGNIIEENKRRGWDERNDLPVAIQVYRPIKKNRRNNHYYTGVSSVSSAMTTLYDDEDYCGVMTTHEDLLIKG